MQLLYLAESVRLVMLQFSFARPNVIPPHVLLRDHETLEEAVARKTNKLPVTQLLEPTPLVAVDPLPTMLEASGYELVGAFCKPRIQYQRADGATYYMVRFSFARHEYATPTEEFLANRDVVRQELRGMTNLVLWRTRAYLNWFFDDNGDPPAGGHDQTVASINLEVRQPMFEPNGRVVQTRRERDADGNRIGEPVPLKPRHLLGVFNNTIELVAMA